MKGISHGEWQQISKPQLKSKQRPCYPLKTRVWSTLILHTDGFQTERATKLERGKAVPITMADIASELNDAAEKYYREAGIEQADTHPVTSEQTRRCIVDFEQDGLCGRQEDGIYCWLIPRTPAPKRVKKQYAEATAETESSDLPQVFKVFHLSLTKKQLQDPQFIARANQAYGAAKKAFLDILESPAKSTHFAFLSPLQDGGTPPQQDGGIYKEEKIVEKKGGGRADSLLISRPAKTPPPPARPPGPSHPKIQPGLAIRGFSADRELLRAIDTILGATPDEWFWKALDERLKRGKIGTGLLVKIAETARQNYEAIQESVEAERKTQEQGRIKTAERHREIARDILNDPTASASDKDWANELLKEAEVT
jgi:hypothetical protein